MNSKILFGHYEFVYTVGCVLTKIYFLDDLNKQVKGQKPKGQIAKSLKANKPLNPKNQNIIWTL